jgi:hypothetical protein
MIMRRCRRFIVLLLAFPGSLLSQEVQYSRSYPVISKSVPLAIINRHEGYFHLLRSNRLAHDFTVERRAKPGGQMLAFAALRLDSVNAHWFDYEELDYLFFEKGLRIFFVFERVQNNRRSLFLKYVDTTGKTGPFMEIAGVEKDRTTESIGMEWRRTNDDNILVVTSKRYFNGTTRREATLFGLSAPGPLWKKRLPLETPSSGNFTGFTCNSLGDLYFLDVKAVFTGDHWTFRPGEPLDAGSLVYEHVAVCAILNDGQGGLLRRETGLRGIERFNTLFLAPHEASVELLASFVTGEEEPAKRMQFQDLVLQRDLSAVITDQRVRLDPVIFADLDFYDGDGPSHAYGKAYSFSGEMKTATGRLIFMERTAPSFHKELLVWRSDLAVQQVLPRKILYFSGRSRFRAISSAMHVACGGRLHSFLLEHPANERIPPLPFRYHEFSKLTGLQGANAVCYSVDVHGALSKRVVHRNRDFFFVPLMYESDRCDFVFYLARGNQERFGFLSFEGP